jgi:hypothetical protein
MATDNRRFDYMFNKAHGWPAKRPKTLRCLRCKKRFVVKPRGRLSDYCSASCRQTAYVTRKCRRLGAVEALAADLGHIRVREWLRREIWQLLREAGLVDPPEPPPTPRSTQKKPTLRVVDPHTDHRD